MDLTSQRNKINLLETQYGATGSESLAQAIGASINFLLDNLQNTPVGSVEESVLTEAQFQAVRGVGWVLMDGRDVTGSTFNTLTGHTHIPSGRARCLRGKNNGRSDGKENPNGDLALGTESTQMMGAHVHGFVFNTNVARNNGTNTKNGGGRNNNSDRDSFALSYVAGGPVPQFPGTDADFVSTPGSEARPRSTIVNFFIRIN